MCALTSSLLDPVLERMMEAVHRYEGTVNQVMGDGKPRPARRSLVDGELLAQLAMPADEEGEEPEQMEYEADHEPRFWPVGAGRSVTCRADEVPAKDNPR